MTREGASRGFCPSCKRHLSVKNKARHQRTCQGKSQPLKARVLSLRYKKQPIETQSSLLKEMEAKVSSWDVTGHKTRRETEVGFEFKTFVLRAARPNLPSASPN